MHLRCINTECAATLDLHDRSLLCAVCGDSLDVVIDPITAPPAELKHEWLQRRCSHDPRDNELAYGGFASSFPAAIPKS